jgi:alginate O-acetyltransferase complex protein AlgI
MIFSSWQFAAFYAVVFAAYWTVRGRFARHLLLLVASCVFYMAWNAWLVLIVLGVAVWDYALALGIDATRRPGIRRGLLALSVIGNLGLLAVFKYADFLILSLRDLLAALGLSTSLHSLHIILPIGISFHVFQTLSYTVDVYRGDIRPTRDFIEFALFVTFFPQLVAGPIVRAAQFLPQLETVKRLEWPRIERCVGLFVLGLTKKLLIADQIAPLVDRVFADPTQFGTLDLWLAMFGYGAQIYGDFSGYSDMAVAVAGMLGFDLPVNFRSPYLAASITDFWRRWHISLSTWLRDNLYIPLGGSRRGRRLTCRNIMITMLLGGLWHGASWTFVIWGAIHGFVLSFDKLRSSGGAESHVDPERRTPGRAGRTLIGWALTLLVVHVAWVFFRCQPIALPGGDPEPLAQPMGRALHFVTHLVVFRSAADAVWLPGRIACIILLALAGGLQLWEEWQHRSRHGRSWLAGWWPSIPVPIAAAALALWVAVLVVWSPGNTNPFIYFQF